MFTVTITGDNGTVAATVAGADIQALIKQLGRNVMLGNVTSFTVDKVKG